jgi:SAM-dependent methyltransferase
MTTYDNNFFKYVNSGAINSANEIFPHLINSLPINSVLDVGCGQGAWLSVWEQFGVKDITGVDGSYVDCDNLLIDKEHFISHDLSDQFNLNRRFDIVQTLEVAEHLSENSARGFIDSLVKHGDLILFSAAPKGQGGDDHVNEQNYDYWRRLFSYHGYRPIDYIRPLIADNKKVEPWYRYNIFLYSSPDYMNMLPEHLQDRIVAEGEKLRDISPPIYKLRKILVGFLPVYVMTLAAKIKEKIVVRKRLS